MNVVFGAKYRFFFYYVVHKEKNCNISKIILRSIYIYNEQTMCNFFFFFFALKKTERKRYLAPRTIDKSLNVSPLRVLVLT